MYDNVLGRHTVEPFGGEPVAALAPLEARRAVLRGVPRLPSHHLPRPRLTAQLSAAESTPIIVLRAPAGYGKSIALSEWVHQRSARAGAPHTIWITVDGTCSSRLTFWTAVDNLLKRAGLAATDATRATFDTVATLPSILLQGFDSLPEPVTLVVDSYELLTDDHVHRDLLRLVRDTNNLNLVIATRTPSGSDGLETGYSFSDTVLVAENLAFTREETGALATELGANVSGCELDIIHANTHGWPLAVRAALMLPVDDSSTIKSNLRVVRERLLGPVVAQPGMKYLAITSVVDSFTEDLAAALGADPRDADILAAVEAKGLGGWEADGSRFRVHPMLREVAASRLDGDLERATYLRLAKWYVRHDRLSDAFLAAIRAGSLAIAVRHAMSAFPEAIGVVSQNAREIAALPRHVVRQHPMLALLSGVAQYASGNIAQAMRRFHLVITMEELIRWRGNGRPTIDHLWSQGALTVALRLSGRYDRVEPALRRYHEMLQLLDGAYEPTEAEELLFATETAATQVYLDRLHCADQTLTGLSPLPDPTAQARRLRYYAHALHALVQAALGEITRARSTLAGLDSIDLPPSLRESYYAIPRNLATALVQLEDHDVEAAASAVALCLPHWPSVEIWPYVLEVHTRVSLAQSGPLAALETLERGLDDKRGHPPMSPALLAMLDATRSELLLAANRAGEAAGLLSWKRRRSHVRIATAHARTLLIRGQFREAAREASQQLDSETLSARRRVELLLLSASAELRSGDVETAAQLFTTATRTALPTGLRQPFVEMPRSDFDALSGSLPEAVRSAVTMTPDYFPVGVQQNSLTSRERTILLALAGPQRGIDIAKDLSISINTMKSHVRTLYRKLGASSREEAVAEARRRHYL